MTVPAHLPVLLGDLVLIIAVARLLGAAATRLGQPAVIGEIAGGILLGPTLLGHAGTTVFPAAVRPALSDVANVGVCVFMFGIGVELDRRLLRGQARMAATVALGAIAVPFGFGVLLALYLLRNHPTAHHAGFVLFMGTAMSVTAFPVLARILTDKKLLRTPIGGLAMACAAARRRAGVDAAGDLGRAGAGGRASVAGAVGGSVSRGDGRCGASGAGAAMRGVMADRAGRRAAANLLVLVAVAVGLAASAVATDRMGLHQIFGAVPVRRGAAARRSRGGA